MSWQLSLALFFIVTVSHTLWARVYSQKSSLHPKLAPALSYIIGVMPLGIIVSLGISDIHINWDRTTVLLLIAEGAFIGLFNWLSFIAWKKVTVAQFQTVFQLYAITTTSVGWIVLGEKLNNAQMIGSVFLIVGALIAANSGVSKDHKYNISTGVALTALSAILLGLGLVAEKAAIDRMSLSAYFIFGYGAQTIALAVIAIKQLASFKISKISKYDLKGAFILGSLSALGGFFYLYALNKADNIGQVISASTFQLPLSVIAGYIILKEKDNIKRLSIASIIAFIGLVINTL
jgi:drug/metabolite transporter (DMT)-like permease